MKEKISALMDGDLAIEDAEYLMTSMKTKGEAAEAWSTYHLIGDVLRDDPVMRSDLTSHIMKEIAKQPVVLAPKPSLLSSASAQYCGRLRPLQQAYFSWVGWCFISRLKMVWHRLKSLKMCHQNIC
jgi:negative regulator of sigma E activity